MNDNGYVYVLMNPSMNDMVKIGKTERDPSDRAKELSATTGVPTPFIVVYNSYFESCTKAEVFVHTYLEDKGYRIASNREFFEIPIKDAIDAVMKAKEHFGEFEKVNQDFDEEGIFSSDINDDFLDDLDFKEIEPGQEMFDIAEDYYYGLDDEIVDYDEAMIYYLKAIKLGYIQAYIKIGIMYNSGEGVRENQKKAFEYFKEGAKRGSIDCYAEIAKMFDGQDNTENALKSWKKYFGTELIDETSQEFKYNAYNYIEFVKRNNLELKHKDKFYGIKDQLINIAEIMIDSSLNDDSEYAYIIEENNRELIKYIETI